MKIVKYITAISVIVLLMAAFTNVIAAKDTDGKSKGSGIPKGSGTQGDGKIPNKKSKTRPCKAQGGDLKSKCAEELGFEQLFEIFLSVDRVMKEFVMSIFKIINVDYGGAITMAMVLYVMIFGARMMMGSIKQPLGEAAKHLLILSGAVILATNPGIFQKNVYELTTNTANHITTCITIKGTAVLALKSTIIFGKLGNKLIKKRCSKYFKYGGGFGGLLLIKLAMDAVNRATKWNNRVGATQDWKVMSFVATGGGYGMLTMAVAYLLIAKVGMAMLMAISPIFFVAYAFKGPVRQLFMGWLRVVLYYVFLQILVSLMLVFILYVMMGDLIFNFALGIKFPTTQQLSLFSLLGAIGMYFLWKASSMAGALTGSLAVAFSMGHTQPAGEAGRKMTETEAYTLRETKNTSAKRNQEKEDIRK